MTLLSFVKPKVGIADKTEDPKLNTALTEIESVVNGSIDKTNLASEVVRAQSGLKYEEKLYTKAEAEAGVEISATRPAFLTLEGVEAILTATVEVGGKSAGKVHEAQSTSFFVFATEKWKVKDEVRAWWRLL